MPIDKVLLMGAPDVEQSSQTMCKLWKYAVDFFAIMLLKASLFL